VNLVNNNTHDKLEQSPQHPSEASAAGTETLAKSRNTVPHRFGAILLLIAFVAVFAKASAAGIPCEMGVEPDCSALGCQALINYNSAFACCSVENPESECCDRACYIGYCVQFGSNGVEPCQQGSGPHVFVDDGVLVPGTNTCDDSYDPVSGTYARCVLESGEEGGGEGEGGD
jgi:hypothetical protein